MPPIPGDTEAVSSTASEIENDALNQDSNPGEGETASESSSPADGKEPVSEKDWDPLSVVKKAIGEDAESKSGAAEGEGGEQTDSSSKSEKGDQEAKNVAEEPLGEVTAKELEGYKPATRKRIEGLLDDRSRLTDELKEIRPAAEQMNILQDFMQERNLTPANVSELLTVGGLVMSEDPKDLRAALVRVDTFRDQILSQLGDKLPEDLQRKVDDGLIDADSAKEVALSRVNTQRATVKIQAAEQQTETAVKTVDTVQITQAKNVVHSTISDWQANKFKSDPEYPRKAELLQKELKLRVNGEPGGVVLDPQRALTIANEAYAEVDRVFKALVPVSAASKRVLTSKANQQQMASTPNSALDAARAGLAKSK